jgi:ketosteroid isomerase-like protein
VRTGRAVPILALATSACFFAGRQPESPPPRQSAERDSLLAADRSRSDSLARLGLPRVMGAFLDPAVVYLRAGAHAVFDKESAIRLIEASRPQAASFVAWQPMGGGVSRDRLTGYTFGIAVRSGPVQSGALVERYVAVWSRTRGGPWRISAYVEVCEGSLSTIRGDTTMARSIRSRPVADMMAADSLFAERSAMLGAPSGARAAFSEDGVLLTTTQLVVGPLAAADYFESLRAFSINWIPRYGRAAASGDLGFTVGEAVATSRGPTGAAMQRFTKYLSVWRKEADGRWRILVTGANDRPSPIGN